MHWGWGWSSSRVPKADAVATPSVVFSGTPCGSLPVLTVLPDHGGGPCSWGPGGEHADDARTTATAVFSASGGALQKRPNAASLLGYRGLPFPVVWGNKTHGPFIIAYIYNRSIFIVVNLLLCLIYKLYHRYVCIVQSVVYMSRVGCYLKFQA